jgi:lactate permease
MYQQSYDAVGNSLALTAIFAVLPLITLFVLLGGLKWSAHCPPSARSRSRS